MTAAVTGHRPHKLNEEYDMKGPVSKAIFDTLSKALIDHNITRGISGMALGVDMLFANACIRLGIPFTAAIPCKGQEQKWPYSSQLLYESILSRADKVVIISPYYTPRAMQARNEWMVDHCDKVFAVWDGSAGGTKNCVDYARKQGRRTYIFNPHDKTKT